MLPLATRYLGRQAFGQARRAVVAQDDDFGIEHLVERGKHIASSNAMQRCLNWQTSAC